MNELTVAVPHELLEHVAERAAEILEERQPKEPERWVGVPEAAAHIGAPKSRIYALVESGRIPHARDGSRLIFRRSELDRWLASNGGGRRP